MPTLHLAEYLDEEAIRLDLSPGDKESFLAAMAGLAAERVPGLAGEELLARLREREAARSTGIGDGLAVPHAVVPGLSRSRILVGRARPPVDFGALDGEPVDLVFLLLSPPDCLKEHVRLLARLARCIGRAEVLERLRGAEGPAEARRILLEEDARHV